MKRGLFFYLLVPFSILYTLIIRTRNTLYNWRIFRSVEFQIPIISVGNITIGGTGKTPHTEYIIHLLMPIGEIAVLSRGYKRKSKGFVKATTESTVAEIGDEPMQMKRKFPTLQVAVDNNRINGINKLMSENADLKAIVLDDAFQHRSVYPGINILLIDYNRPLSSDFMLPAGRLREPATGIERANIVILTKCPKILKPIDQRLLGLSLNLKPYQTLYFTYLEYGHPLPVFENNEKSWSFDSENKPSSVLIVTGIAQARPFVEHIEEIAPTVKHLEYPDHFNFTEKEVAEINTEFENLSGNSKIILTTEKDAMRLMSMNSFSVTAHSSMYYIPIEVRFLNEGKEHFDNQIISYVRKNKRDSLLYRK
jgi:tetraacyldisaccharide 4'-kinase